MKTLYDIIIYLIVLEMQPPLFYRIILIEFEPTNTTTPDPLSVDRILELWSKTYNTEGKPDWSHIFPLL